MRPTFIYAIVCGVSVAGKRGPRLSQRRCSADTMRLDGVTMIRRGILVALGNLFVMFGDGAVI